MMREPQQHRSLNILAENAFKIDKKFLIKFSKEDSKVVDREAKINCKILQFSYEWSFDEGLEAIASLDREQYPNLFIFIIESKRIELNGEITNLEKILFQFSKLRPLILQLTSNEDEITKFYYRESDSDYLFEINQHEKNFEELRNFPSFLMMILNGEIESIKNLVINNMPHVNNRVLIIRFFRILKMSEKFFTKMVLQSAECGSKNDLLAALDSPFEGNGRMLNAEAQNCLMNVIDEEELTDDKNSEAERWEEEEEPVNDDSASIGASSSDHGDDSYFEEPPASDDSHLSPSVLYKAVENKNKEIIDYLITYWTHLIQQLPFKHQIKISTTAFESNQLEVLCDLLEISDFPFPANFKLESVEHERLLKIAKEKKDFENAIKSSSLDAIDKFIDNNRNLRIAYNTSNKSALQQAVDLKNYKVYFHLCSFGFKATEFDSLEKVLSADELKKANRYVVRQRKKNVNEALPDEDKSVYSLLMRSLIHNRKISKEQEAEYRAKIKKWYEDIKKIKSGPELLDAAASCEFLKIIFDFESDSVERVSLEGPNAAGSMYPKSKWIFVGANLSDEKREQQIKGVLAHELCHYVMKLVFENKENPYYRHRTDCSEKFKALVKAIDKWSAKDSSGSDDECNGAIASVFKLYNSEDFHPELIVRVVQILAEFGNNEEKLKHLGKKYQILFDFWQDHVHPELLIFSLKRRGSVRKLNRTFELLDAIKSENFEFPATDATKKLLNNKVTIVTTNISKLLLINIFNFLKDEFGDLLDAQNLFVDPKKLIIQELRNDFKELVKESSNLNIFIDCTRERNPECLDNIFVNRELNVIFIISNEDHLMNRVSSMIKYDIIPSEVNMSYNCIDLIEHCQSFDSDSSKASKLLSKLNLNINSRVLSTDEAIPDIPFKNVTISNIQVNSDSAKLVEIFKRIENSIEFMGLEYVTVIDIKRLQEIFSGLSNLTTLNLHACSIDKLNDETLPPIPSLKSVTFDECHGNFFTLFNNQSSIEKVKVCSRQRKTTIFSYGDFAAMTATLPNLSHIAFDGTGTGRYFEYGKFPYKIRKLDAFLISFWWKKTIPRLNFLKLQQGHLKELTLQKLPYDYDGGNVLKFIIEEMGLEKLYYGTIPLILDGKKQEVERFVATEVQIFSTFEMFRQFPSIQSFTMFLTYTNLKKEKIERILNARTDLFENLRDLDVLDHSGTKHLFPLYIGLYKNCRNITRLSFRTDDESINSVFRECLPEMTKLNEIYLGTRKVESMERLEAIREFAPNIRKLSISEQFVSEAKNFFRNEVEIIGLKMNIQPECFSFD